MPLPTKKERARRLKQKVEQLVTLIAANGQHTQLASLLAKHWQLLYGIAWDSSEALRLLRDLGPMVASREVISSAEIVRQLNADKDGEWCKFRGKRPITERQVATLLGQYDVSPTTIHPTKRSAKSPRGYKCADIRVAITRLLPHDPHIAPWLHQH